MTENAERPRARVAEARRNRQALLDAAAAAFGSGAADVPLTTIAKAAGVGIATLYRHFPTRGALVEAVYGDQIERLRAGADHLLATQPPARAFREWMDLFGEWSLTKHGMTEALRAAMAHGDLTAGRMRAELTAAVARFLDAGAAVGDLRSDVDPADISALLAGVLAVAEGGDRAQLSRLMDLISDGLRPPH